MDMVIGITNRIFSVLFMPFRDMRPDLALLVISAFTGVGMLYLYKWTSNQTELKKIQDRIKAHILEIRLYREDIHVMLRALYRVFARNLTYLRLLMVPALILAFCAVVILIQCYPRFGYRPFKPGEKIIMTATLKNWDDDTVKLARLAVPEGISIETPPFAVPESKEISWRLKAASARTYKLVITSKGESMEKTLTVGTALVGVSPRRAGLSIRNYIASPLEEPLGAGNAFKQITLGYPQRDMHSALMFGLNWWVYFFVVSFVAALALKAAVKTY